MVLSEEFNINVSYFCALMHFCWLATSTQLADKLSSYFVTFFYTPNGRDNITVAIVQLIFFDTTQDTYSPWRWIKGVPGFDMTVA